MHRGQAPWMHRAGSEGPPEAERRHGAQHDIVKEEKKRTKDKATLLEAMEMSKKSEEERGAAWTRARLRRRPLRRCRNGKWKESWRRRSKPVSRDWRTSTDTWTHSPSTMTVTCPWRKRQVRLAVLLTSVFL